MSYRYKQDFGKCFYDLPLPQHEGTISHPLIELDEVYRKAQTFDQLAHTYERYRHSHAHDLKLLLGMKAIELLEADE